MGLFGSIIGSFVVRNILTMGLSKVTDSFVGKVTAKERAVNQVTHAPTTKTAEESSTRNFADIVLGLGFWYEIAVMALDLGVESYFGTYSGLIAMVLGVFIKFYRWKTNKAIA